MAKATIDGEARLIKKLAKLGDKRAARRALRKAASYAITPLAQAVRRNAPTDTGALRKSIGRDVRAKGYSVDARVGVRAGYEQGGRKPAKYQHLVEFGTEHAPAKPFLRPGYDEAEGAMKRRYKEKLAGAIRAEADKLARRR